MCQLFVSPGVVGLLDHLPQSCAEDRFAALTYVLDLVAVLFQTDFPQVAERPHYGRHAGGMDQRLWLRVPSSVQFRATAKLTYLQTSTDRRWTNDVPGLPRMNIDHLPCLR